MEHGVAPKGIRPCGVDGGEKILGPGAKRDVKERVVQSRVVWRDEARPRMRRADEVAGCLTDHSKERDLLAEVEQVAKK